MAGRKLAARRGLVRHDGTGRLIESLEQRVLLAAAPAPGDGLVAPLESVVSGPAIPSSFAGQVWRDSNGNGVRDAGEAAVQGACVNLLNAAGVAIPGQTTYTDSAGAYAFRYLPAGSYAAQFVALAGHPFTIPNVGGDSAVDSDAAVKTGKTGAFAFNGTTAVTGVDAGITGAGPIFNGNSADFSQVPFIHATAGTKRVFQGFAETAGQTMAMNFTAVKYLGVNALTLTAGGQLKWVAALDTSGTPWLLKEFELDRNLPDLRFVAASLNDAIRMVDADHIDDAFWGTLASGSYGVGTTITCPGGENATVDDLAATLPDYPGQTFVKVMVDYVDDPYYIYCHPTYGWIYGVEDNGGAPGEGFKMKTWPATSTLSVAAKVANASETLAGGKGKGVFRFTRAGGALAEPVTVNYAVAGGSATEGSDYVPLSGSATIPAGKAFVDVALFPVDDSLPENSETVILTLSASADYNLGLPANRSATVTIADNEPMVTISRNKDASEKDPMAKGEGKFVVARAGGSKAGDLVVHYTVAGNADGHYIPLPGTVTIPAGKPSAVIDVNPITDVTVDGPMSVVVTLDASSPTWGYRLGPTVATQSATVAIADVDAFAGKRTFVLRGNDNIRSDVGLYTQKISGTVTRIDATHLNIVAHGTTFPMVQDGNFLSLATQPTEFDTWQTPNTFIASDGVNGAMLTMGQEGYDLDDISISVGAWSNSKTAVSTAALAGTWQCDVYSDTNLRLHPGDPFNKESWSFTLADLGGGRMQLSFLSGGPGTMVLKMVGNHFVVTSAPAGTSYDDFEMYTDGTRMSFVWISSDSGNPGMVTGAGIGVGHLV